MNMEQNPVLFWLIWVLLRKKKKTYDIHVMFEPITPPDFFGVTRGNPPLNGRKDEYPKFFVAKIYNGDKYLGWYTYVDYVPAYGGCYQYGNLACEEIQTISQSGGYYVKKYKRTINGIAEEYTSSQYALHMHFAFDQIDYGAGMDTYHQEFNSSVNFNLTPYEKSYGDEGASGLVNVFGDGLTLEKYKEVFKEFPNATFGFSNGGTEE